MRFLGEWKVNCWHMCVYIANNLTSASVFVFGEMKLNSSCQSRERLGPSRSFEKRWGLR